MILPPDFLFRMEQQLGSEMPAFLAAMDQPPVRGIRIHEKKAGADLFQRDLPEPVPWSDHGYYLSRQSVLGSTVWHEAGAFYLQDPSAMIAAAVLNARPGELILDLCAAPGGKSVAIGAAMEGQGTLICNEPVSERARILSGNIERMGIPNAVVVSARPRQLAEQWGPVFDAVLVDAPCSGEGMFRKDPEAIRQWTPEHASGCAGRQRVILTSAAELVRPGGRLVYATCTWNPEENNGNRDWFLNQFQDFQPEGFQLPGISGTDGTFTCYPHRIKGEGQYIALFRRKETDEQIERRMLYSFNKTFSDRRGFGRRSESPPESSRRNSVSSMSINPFPELTKAERKAAAEAFPGFPVPTHRFGKTLTVMPELPDLRGIKVLRCGLHLLEERGKVLVPDHAAALAVPPPDCLKTEIGEAEALRYMAGEALPGQTRGWTLLTLKGMGIGWAKGSDGTLKNHYPKGLRRNQLSAWLSGDGKEASQRSGIG